MITGKVSSDGVPIIQLLVASNDWTAVIDTGFNGDLELPLELKSQLSAKLLGTVKSLLAGGQTIVEENYAVEFPFDNSTVIAEATFVEGNEILIGTGLLREYRLEIDFPDNTVVIQRNSKTG